MSLRDVLDPGTLKLLEQSGAGARMSAANGLMRPVCLICETVNFCNADCIFCPYSLQVRARGFMTQDLFRRVVDEYLAIGGGHISLTPMLGDVLLDRHLMERLALLQQHREKLIPSVTTNMYALGRFSDEEVVTILRTFRHIQISIYGLSEEECEQITRRRGMMAKLTEQMKRLLAIRAGIPDACSLTIGYRFVRKHDESRIVEFARENFGEAVGCGWTYTYSNWGNTFHRELPPDAQWAPVNENRAPCILLATAVQVYWDGRVSACACCDYEASAELALGSLAEMSLAEMFNGEANRRLWRSHQSGQLPQFCRRCSFFHPMAALAAGHPLGSGNIWNFIGG